MTLVRIKGFQIYTSKGKVYCYHRKTKTPIDLVTCPLGSPAFIAAVSRIERNLSIAAEPRPGTIGLLMKRYAMHHDFLKLAQRTRQDYSRCFDYLKGIGETPLSKFTPPLIVQIRDKAGKDLGRKWGNYVVTVLSVMFSHGLERGYVTTNPCKGLRKIKRDKSAPRANRPWADNERDAVMAALPHHMRLPFALMMYCGLDPVDVRTMPKTAIKAGQINLDRAKTGESLWKPLPRPAFEAWRAAPGHKAMTLCATSKGTPWTKTGLESSWAAVRSKLQRVGLVESGLTMKGLRHTVGTILAEMGLDDRAIADFLGHKTLQSARHYSDRADKTATVTATVMRFNDEIAKRKANKNGT